MLFIRRQTITCMLLIAFLSCGTDGFFWSSSSEPEEAPKPQLYAYPLPSIYYQRYLQAQQQLQHDQPIQQLQHSQPIQQLQHGQPIQQVPIENQELLNQGAIPAIPIEVPLQAHFSPVQNLHNVQLVPCLCPVSPNVEYEKGQEQASSRAL